MPPLPGPVYNWLCVFSSVGEIVGHATRIHAQRAIRATASTGGLNTHRPSAAMQFNPAVDLNPQNEPIMPKKLVENSANDAPSVRF